VQRTMRIRRAFARLTRIRAAAHFPHVYSTVGFRPISTGGAFPTAATIIGSGTTLSVF
jgi:hypothetical protein